MYFGTNLKEYGRKLRNVLRAFSGMNPARDWSLGLALAVAAFSVTMPYGVFMLGAALDDRYGMDNVSIQTVLYDNKQVREALKLYEERADMFTEHRRDRAHASSPDTASGGGEPDSVLPVRTE